MSSYKIKQSRSVRVGIPKEDLAKVKLTFSLYWDLIAKLIPIVRNEWGTLENLKGKQKAAHIEKLIHTTKPRYTTLDDGTRIIKNEGHTAKYPFFDRQFPYFPNYLMRSAINFAIGHVSAWKEWVVKWEEEGCKGKKPHLKPNPKPSMPLYKDNMIKWLDNLTPQIKVYDGKCASYVKANIMPSDYKWLKSHKGEFLFQDLSYAPVLKWNGRKLTMQFLFESKVELPDITKRICAVDLGINTHAVCVIMNEDGTILARKFITVAGVEDHIRSLTRQARKHQSKGDQKKKRKCYHLRSGYQTHLINELAHQIVEFAVEHGADCLVMEYLDFRGSKKGKKSKKKKTIEKRTRLTAWNYGAITDKLEALAHANAMRFSRVCARNSSKLAFDGSGEITRDNKHAQNCTFTSGKQYNTDLNAAYNIGARYFIRNLENQGQCISDSKLKQMNTSGDLDTPISKSGAKVPLSGKRTLQTLATLLNLMVEIAAA